MLNSTELYKMIEAKFPAPAWVTFREVASGIGETSTRRADALSMAVWPSRGLEIHGFEIKCYRNDWIKELKTPAKSHEIQRFCDRWWIVASDENIVKLDELPPTWGLLVAKGKGLKAIKPAPLLESEPINKTFLASVLRHAYNDIEHLKLAAKQEVIEHAKNNAFELVSDEHKQELRFARNEAASLKLRIEEFEKASGVSIDYWNAGNIGRDVALVRKIYRQDPKAELQRLVNSLQSLTDSIKNEIEVIEKIKMEHK